MIFGFFAPGTSPFNLGLGRFSLISSYNAHNAIHTRAALIHWNIQFTYANTKERNQSILYMKDFRWNSDICSQKIGATCLFFNAALND